MTHYAGNDGATEWLPSTRKDFSNNCVVMAGKSYQEHIVRISKLSRGRQRGMISTISQLYKVSKKQIRADIAAITPEV